MIAYNSLWLGNLYIREQAAEAFHQHSLEKEELDHINSKYRVDFYSPNFFIRIGMFVLTIVILLFSFGLLALLLRDSIDHAIGGLAIFFAFISYVLLEYMVQTKNHFQSGVDDALLWISACSLFGGISQLTYAGDLENCMIIFIISLFFSARFADKGMIVVLFISILGIFFFTCARSGALGKALVPFVLMTVSATCYLLLKKIKRSEINQLYSNCVQVVSVAALFSFYLSGNYYIVRELINNMLNLNQATNGSIPPGWLFWLFTLLIPCLYVIRGVQKRDIVLIRVGMLLAAAIVFTVRYYYSVAPIELIMTAGGIVLMIVAYVLTRYLKIPKYGFSNLELASADAIVKLQTESILLAQTLTSQRGSSDSTNFGGGSFGGGGSSGAF